MTNDICYPKGIVLGDPLVYGGTNTLCNIRNDKISANKDHITCSSCRLTLGLTLLHPDTEKRLQEHIKQYDTEIKQTGVKTQVEQKINGPTNISEFKQDLTPHYVEIWTGPKGHPCFKIKVSSSEPGLATEDALAQYNRLARAIDPRWKDILLDQVVPIEPVVAPVPKKSLAELTAKFSKLKPHINTFGFFLKKYRLEKDKDILILSETLNRDVEDIFMMENNTMWPNKEEILLISDALHLTDKQYTKLKEKLEQELK